MDLKKLEGVAHAQGWVGAQIESIVGDTAAVVGLKEHWKTIDAALDELIRENRLQDETLQAIRVALGPES